MLACYYLSWARTFLPLKAAWILIVAFSNSFYCFFACISLRTWLPLKIDCILTTSLSSSQVCTWDSSWPSSALKCSSLSSVLGSTPSPSPALRPLEHSRLLASSRIWRWSFSCWRSYLSFSIFSLMLLIFFVMLSPFFWTTFFLGVCSWKHLSWLL